MAWFKVDDSFWSHPKVMALSSDAIALWVRAGSYACQHLTDGVVPGVALRMLGTVEAAEELVSAGLWRNVTVTRDSHAPVTRDGHSGVLGSYVFHDWDQYQETSSAVRGRREQARDRQRRARAQRGRRGETAGQGDDPPGVTPPVTRDSHAPVTRDFSTPDPTRPIEETTSLLPPSPPTESRLPVVRESASTARMRELNATTASTPARDVARGYTGWAGGGIDSRTQAEIAHEVDPLLADGIDPRQIADGIKAWHSSNSFSPTQIRRFVAKAARPPTAQQPTKATLRAVDTLTVAEQIIAAMNQETA